MKGVINKGIQDLVVSRFGEPAWEKVKQIAECNEPFFSISRDYPDEMTLKLAAAAAGVAQVSIEDALVAFGRYWITNTGPEAYPQYFKLAGDTAREFLLNVNRIHMHATSSIANAKPPRFEYEELPGGSLRIHYRSARHFCIVLKGLILGVGDYFGESIEVEEVACTQRGSDACIMEVTFDDT